MTLLTRTTSLLVAGMLLSVPAQRSVAQAAVAPISAEGSGGGAPALINGYEPKWWKEAVVYQVYPRSFKDSNGDGIGDLNGLTSKLDYLKQLGINVIWLSPHYDSPNADNGYDIRDYRKVMTEFGTMGDFDRLLAGVKQRGMRLIVDLVVNHTSDEHRWFVQSASSKTSPYRNYYIWRDGKVDPSAPAANGAPAGLAPPNNYASFFSGSAWQYSEPTKQFYLHLFARKQPDLNWDDPKVRQEVYSLMRFWLDKGVDGFRMDVIPLISKQPGLPDTKPGEDYVRTWANGPRRDEYLQEMNREVLAKYDDMTVGEAIGITLAEEPKIIGSERHELNTVFNFDAIRVNRGAGYTERPWKLPELKAIYAEHARVLGKGDWDTVFLSNHDNPRLVSNFGDDSPASAKLLEAMLLTLRGTTFLYEGDELGMTNYPFKNLADFDDIEVKNAYQARVVTKKEISVADFLAESRRFGRDNSRTPMQWDATANAGFSAGPNAATAKPWLAINPNYTTVNAAAELADPDSVFHFTQKMIALRHAHPALIYGEYKDLAPEDPQVFAYTRELPGERLLVVLNFSKTAASFSLPSDVSAATLLLSNAGEVKEAAGTLELRPWEARVYRY